MIKLSFSTPDADATTVVVVVVVVVSADANVDVSEPDPSEPLDVDGSTTEETIGCAPDSDIEPDTVDDCDDKVVVVDANVDDWVDVVLVVVVGLGVLGLAVVVVVVAIVVVVVVVGGPEQRMTIEPSPPR